MEEFKSYAISAENKLYKYEPFARAHDDAYDQFRKNVDKYYDSEIEENVDDLQKALYELNKQLEVDKLLENDKSIAKLQDIAVLAINQIAKARNRCTATLQRSTVFCPAIEAVEKLKNK